MADISSKKMPVGVVVTVGVLLAIPVLALLWVAVYAKDGPELWGFPFFYWYQFLWVLLASCFTSAAYAVIRRARGERGNP